MIVEGISKRIILDQFSNDADKREIHVTPGKLYIVYGLQFNKDGSRYIQIVTDTGYLSQVPLEFFKIFNDKASKYWHLKVWEDNDITLWPSIFYEPFFHDDLSEGIERSVNDFITITNLLKEENNFQEFLP